MKYKEITPEKVTQKMSSDKFEKETFLIITKNKNEINFMTGSCATAGNIWSKPVFVIHIRPQRYSTKLLRETNEFTINFIKDAEDKLLYTGSATGCKENKVVNSGFSLDAMGTVPYVKEADLVIECKVIYRQPMNKFSFVDKQIARDWYPKDDFSVMYIGEIVKAYEKLK